MEYKSGQLSVFCYVRPGAGAAGKHGRKGGLIGMGFAEDIFAEESGGPLLRNPEPIMIIVVGGPGRRSLLAADLWSEDACRFSVFPISRVTL